LVVKAGMLSPAVMTISTTLRRSRRNSDPTECDVERERAAACGHVGKPPAGSECSLSDGLQWAVSIDCAVVVQSMQALRSVGSPAQRVQPETLSSCVPRPAQLGCRADRIPRPASGEADKTAPRPIQ